MRFVISIIIVMLISFVKPTHAMEREDPKGKAITYCTAQFSQLELRNFAELVVQNDLMQVKKIHNKTPNIIKAFDDYFVCKATNTSGLSFLAIAAAYGHEEMVKYFLDHTVSPSACIWFKPYQPGYASLHAVCTSPVVSDEKALAIAKMLVTHGATISAPAIPLILIQNEGDTILNISATTAIVPSVLAHFSSKAQTAKYLEKITRKNARKAVSFKGNGIIVFKQLERYAGLLDETKEETIQQQNPKEITVSERHVAKCVHTIIKKGAKVRRCLYIGTHTGACLHLKIAKGKRLCIDDVARIWHYCYPLEALKHDCLFAQQHVHTIRKLKKIDPLSYIMSILF